MELGEHDPECENAKPVKSVSRCFTIDLVVDISCVFHEDSEAHRRRLGEMPVK